MEYSTKELLKNTGISESTLRKWLKEGDRIPELNDVKRDWRGWRIWEDRHIEAVLRYKEKKSNELERK
ncbi:MAG: MerR family transcriptional regulator [Thermodesulfobacteriota bacterium]|nr:MerR family transcriptional regulator [Thermodesulfobacteriota bacterium]